MTMFEPPEKSYGGYIFDCDGTLVNSMPLHFEAWLAAFAEYGADFDFTWELFLSRAGVSLEDTVVALNAQFSTDLDPAVVAAAQRAHFDARIHALEPIAPVVEYARRLASEGAPLSIASGNTRQSVTTTLNVIGLSEVFPIIVTPADVERGKPEPDMFLLAAARMGVPPERCVVFEDSLLGIEAARRGGMSAVLVRSAARPRSP